MEAKDFAEAFLGRLARDDFHAAGSLSAYLALPEAKRAGDEANIVDARVTRALLEALGFAAAETDYNAGKESLRPDYVVRIREYPGCCFVVEDKTTTERRLEEHRPQLASYMAMLRSPRGLLVNGARLLGYDDAGPSAAATLELGLGAAVRIWRGEDLLAGGKTGWEALPEAERDALAVLLRRYGRTAYQGVARLVDDLTLDRDGMPHAPDGSSWRPGRARLPIVDARDAPGGLVEAIQELIGELREDVAVQYAARQREYDAFREEVAHAPGSTAPAEAVMEGIADRMLGVLPASNGSRRDALRARLRQAMRGERPEAEIEEVAAEVRAAAGGGQPGRGADAPGRAAAEARAFASRYGRHLMRARERHAAGVEAVEAYRAQARAEGHPEIPPGRVQGVLEELRNGLVGFDLNPFACALAEINLLVQVLDLVKHAHDAGQPARLDRFRVYATDALRLQPGARAAVEAGLDRAEAEDLPEEEQAKAGIGRFAEGFDAVVGNPPYVRADEGAAGLLEYRRQVEDHPVETVREVLAQKWDLFVPFVALGLHLLRRSGGRLGMIVSNALETVLYARKLREQLAAASRVREVHFFLPSVKLFEDAAVRNTILIAEASAPGEGSETLREWHAGPPPLTRQRQRLPQAGYGAEVFRPALPALRVPAAAQAHALKHACYVSVGMVLSAHERRDGGRHKGTFKLDDLLQVRPDVVHPKPYVGSEDLRISDALAGDFLFAPARISYLEYGTARVPALIRRPTFPELYDREKLMVGEFGGAVHDDGTLDPRGFLACNHSVFLFLPWRLLAGVRNASLRDRQQELAQTREALETISDLYPLPFLAGLFNSETWDRLMLGRATTSIAGRAQPSNFADQPVPVPDPALAAEVGRAAGAAREEGRALAALIAAGWQRHPAGWRAPPSLPADVREAPFGVARTRWGLTVERPTARCDTLTRDGEALLAGRRVAARLAPSTPPEAADFLLRRLAGEGSTTLEAVEAHGMQVPLLPEDAAAAERALLAAERAALEREERILAHRRTIDALVAPLFEAVPHPPMEMPDPLPA